MSGTLDRLQQFIDAERLREAGVPVIGRVVGAANRYATMDPFNCDCAAIALQREGGYVWMYRGDGTGGWLLPGITHADEYLWSRSDRRRLYHLANRNELRWLDTGHFANTGIVEKFTEYQDVKGMGESDLSSDGSKIVLRGDGRDVFTFNILTGAKSAVAPSLPDLDSLYITDHYVLQSSKQKGIGVWAYDHAMKPIGQIAPASGHMDVCQQDGEEWLVWCNSGDDTGPNRTAAPDGNGGRFPNGLIRILIRDASQRLGLASFDWSLGMHVSGLDNRGWVLAETYRTKASDPMTPHSNKVLQVRLDGGGVKALADFGDDAVFPDSEAQPRAAVSHDGSRFVYTLNGDSYIQEVR